VVGAAQLAALAVEHAGALDGEPHLGVGGGGGSGRGGRGPEGRGEGGG
jgi:hypothetical protein